MENNMKHFSLLASKAPRSSLVEGCGCLGLGKGFRSWCWLWGLGLFDSRSRHHLRRSGGKATGSRPDLQRYTQEKRNYVEETLRCGARWLLSTRRKKLGFLMTQS